VRSSCDNDDDIDDIDDGDDVADAGDNDDDDAGVDDDDDDNDAGSRSRGRPIISIAWAMVKRKGKVALCKGEFRERPLI